MRNNQKHGGKSEYNDIFAKYARIEKIRRFFSIKRQKVYKHFMIQPYHGNFVKKHIPEFIKAVDDFLKIDGKLADNFKAQEHFSKLKDDETIPFEVFYNTMAKWALSQEKLSYDDFGKHEEELAREEEI